MRDTGRVVLGVITDTHTGSPFAVSPSRWLLPPATEWRPNPLQELINAHWLECHDRLATLRRKARLIMLYKGDLREGLHHDTREVITQRLEVQEAMSIAVIDAGLKRAKYNPRTDTLRFVPGTDAHDGLGSEGFHRIARAVLGVDAQDATDYTCYDDEFTVNDVGFAVTHKPSSGPGSRAQTSGNAFQAWLKSLYLTWLEAGWYPRYVLCGHYHNYMRRDVYGLNDNTVVMTGFISPAWKIADAHVSKGYPFGLRYVGMIAFDITSDGQVTEYDWRIQVPRAERQAL